MQFEAQISAKMGRMKSGTGRERPHSKKPKRVETEGNSEERKSVDAQKRTPRRRVKKPVNQKISNNRQNNLMSVKY